MRVGIVTLTGYFNYGNRLQNLALQKVLESLDIDVQTIEVGLEYKRSKKTILRRLMISFFSFMKIKKNIVDKHKNILIDEKRNSRIYKWSSKNIRISTYRLLDGGVNSHINSKFDYFITGSDQVWNPYYEGYKGQYFLDFADQNKRLSYAASFGVSQIPDEKIKEYKSWISQMNHISVREHEGKNIVERLTNKKADVVLDPTMLLNKDEWLKIMNKPCDMPSKRYILTYFLGEKDDNYHNFIKSLEKEKDLVVIDVLDKNSNFYCVDPSEFIYLINHADVMITDSFHGAVFSILMETPFVIFERQDNCVSMNSRIDTLVSTFKMESRLSRNIKSIENVYNINFNHVDEILKYEREKAIRYLKNAFSM